MTRSIDEIIADLTPERQEEIAAKHAELVMDEWKRYLKSHIDKRNDVRKVEVNDVVQIDPAQDKDWGGCYLTVTEVKTWGVQGYVQEPLKTGQAFYRVKWEAINYIGTSEWALPRPAEDET